MRAYSQDFRDLALRALERGERPCDIARRLEVSRYWVYDVRDRYLKNGERSSYQLGGHRRSCIAHMKDEIFGWLQVEPDLTLAQMCERLSLQGIQIKIAGLSKQLIKWGVSYKKNAARQRARARRCPVETP